MISDVGSIYVGCWEMHWNNIVLKRCLFSFFVIVIFVIIARRCWLEYDLRSTLLQRNVYVIWWTICRWLLCILTICWSRILNALPNSNLNLNNSMKNSLNNCYSENKNKNKTKTNNIVDSYALLGNLFYRLTLSEFSWPELFFFFFIFWSFISIDVFGVITFRVSQCNIWSCLMLFNIYWFIEKIVDYMIFGRLLASVVIWWWHTNQVHLMELETFGTNPWVFLIFMTIMEHFTVYTFVSVVSVQEKK